MAPPSTAEEHQAAQARQAAAAALLTARQWRTMNPDDLDSSWAKIVQRLTAIVAFAQLGAAQAGAAYVPLALAEIGIEVDPLGEVNPARFAGSAGDGRPLDSLLFAAVAHTKHRLSLGATPVEALQFGGFALDMIVKTQVADAGRQAAGVAITARPRVGYTRMVAPPCCQRCGVLAGKAFTWNTGFSRHPRCDCRHIPTREGDPAGFASDIGPEHIRDLSKGQRQAIADGADLNQVVNAKRRRSGMTTSEGTTRRGLYGGRAGAVPQRLTPEGIYRVASTRAEAVSLLQRFGYIR